MSNSVGIIGVGDTSKRLGDKGDCKHFDTLAQREFGRRYAEAFLKTVAAETMRI